MLQFNEVYQKNKELDQVFDNLYDASNYDIIRKNKLELLVELGELANETKCFKYWSNKPIQLDKVKEEYADCLIMVLCFFNMYDIKLDEDFRQTKIKRDLVDMIGHLYKLCSDFYHEDNRDLIKMIFVDFIELGYLLELSDDDIINACLVKIKKNHERFVDGF